tara:strand:- start:712 stop:1566 length:855 start_codon:yes stop_codon:yes gene_type:complete
MDVGLSLLGGLIRDIVVTTVTLVNQRKKWLIVGSGRSGVTTLQAAMQSRSDIMPDVPTTTSKIQPRILKGSMNGRTFRFRAADMKNQPDGRHQYLEEVLDRPTGVVFLFKTFNVDEKNNIEAPHLFDESEFLQADGFWRHEMDYQQFRFITTALLYPEQLEQRYPKVFKDSSLVSDIRTRFLNTTKGYVPKICIMAGNFIDLTFDMDSSWSGEQYDSEMRKFLFPYMVTFEPLTSQWQRFHRKGMWGKTLPSCAMNYVGCSAKYNIGVDKILWLMRNSTSVFGG